jgi:NitT/TauT family transport system substrate-binding protein
MRSFTLPITAVVIAAAILSSAGVAISKEVIKFASQQDPVFIAAAWPVQHGKVKSDVVDIEFSFLGIGGLNQAPATRQYDVVHTASLSVPRARAEGIPMSVIAISLRYPPKGDGANIWVKDASPYKTISDLKGKTIGTYGLNSGGFTNVREVLALKYGFNTALEGGDFRFVELPAPALPAALDAGRIDAATLVHSQIYKAKKAGGIRAIVNVQEDSYQLFGLQIPSLVLTAYTDRLNAKPEVYKAFLKLLQDSIAYLHSHQDEVFTAVGKEQHIDPEYFRMWFSDFGDIPYSLSANDISALRKSWEAANKIGALPEVPDVESLVWRPGMVK